jgi:hypothetical protein
MKIIVGGKTPIVYAESGGWSSWNEWIVGMEKSPTIAKLILDRKPAQAIQDAAEALWPGCVASAAGHLAVRWLPVGTMYMVVLSQNGERIETEFRKA